MVLNNEKMISILEKECNEIEEQCEGYRNRISTLIGDVLDDVHHHSISATHIQKKINERCSNAAKFLVEHQDTSSTNMKKANS